MGCHYESSCEVITKLRESLDGKAGPRRQTSMMNCSESERLDNFVEDPDLEDGPMQ